MHVLDIYKFEIDQINSKIYEAIGNRSFRATFLGRATLMYRHWKCGICVVKVRSLLNGHTCSVLLKSLSGELGKL